VVKDVPPPPDMTTIPDMTTPPDLGGGGSGGGGGGGGTGQKVTANAGPDPNVAKGASGALDGTGRTGDMITVAWLQTAGAAGAVTLSSDTIASPTFTAPSKDTVIIFKLTVKDAAGKSASDFVTITVGQSGGGGGCSCSTTGATSAPVAAFPLVALVLFGLLRRR